MLRLAHIGHCAITLLARWMDMRKIHGQEDMDHLGKEINCNYAEEMFVLIFLVPKKCLLDILHNLALKHMCLYRLHSQVRLALTSLVGPSGEGAKECM